MTLFHYLGADRELPEGDYGEIYTLQKLPGVPKPDDPTDLRNILDLSYLDDTWVKVYESELDATYVTINKMTSPELSSALPFQKKYIYELHGSFQLRQSDRDTNPETYTANLKCVTQLITYLREELAEGEAVEIYSCWAGEESWPMEEELSLILDQIADSGDFILKDKKLVTVTNTSTHKEP